ncbi:hypothetical protein DFS34DRAFT_614690 [Phlyctochytrium arcticum]|nr:hypothetical protein DFS34DRAFT_614690 [Phlyctochytrium arcticum]
MASRVMNRAAAEDDFSSDESGGEEEEQFYQGVEEFQYRPPPAGSRNDSGIDPTAAEYSEEFLARLLLGSDLAEIMLSSDLKYGSERWPAAEPLPPSEDDTSFARPSNEGLNDSEEEEADEIEFEAWETSREAEQQSYGQSDSPKSRDTPLPRRTDQDIKKLSETWASAVRLPGQELPKPTTPPEKEQTNLVSSPEKASEKEETKLVNSPEKEQPAPAQSESNSSQPVIDSAMKTIVVEGTAVSVTVEPSVAQPNESSIPAATQALPAIPRVTESLSVTVNSWQTALPPPSQDTLQTDQVTFSYFDEVHGDYLDDLPDLAHNSPATGENTPTRPTAPATPIASPATLAAALLSVPAAVESPNAILPEELGDGYHDLPDAGASRSPTTGGNTPTRPAALAAPTAPPAAATVAAALTAQEDEDFPEDHGDGLDDIPDLGAYTDPTTDGPTTTRMTTVVVEKTTATVVVNKNVPTSVAVAAGKARVEAVATQPRTRPSETKPSGARPPVPRSSSAGSGSESAPNANFFRPTSSSASRRLSRPEQSTRRPERVRPPIVPVQRNPNQQRAVKSWNFYAETGELPPPPEPTEEPAVEATPAVEEPVVQKTRTPIWKWDYLLGAVVPVYIDEPDVAPAEVHPLVGYYDEQQGDGRVIATDPPTSYFAPPVVEGRRKLGKKRAMGRSR